MPNLIRNELMEQDDDTVEGTVEMDETYVGGKGRGMTGVPVPRTSEVGCVRNGSA